LFLENKYRRAQGSPAENTDGWQHVGVAENALTGDGIAGT
jgi:hypothetical protein